jgi:spore coat protein U-like protein
MSLRCLRLLTLAWLLLPWRIDASTGCTASMSDIAFGEVNPFGGTVDVTASLSFSCTTTLLAAGEAAVRACFSIGSGAQGDGGINPRRMLSGANALFFTLYRDASRSLIWGTRSGSSHVEISFRIPVVLLGSTYNDTITAYGRVPAGQNALIPGSYSNAFSGAHTLMEWRWAESTLISPTMPSSCTSGGGGGGTTSFPFTATAAVSPACNPSFTVQDIDFGTHGLLSTSIDSSATVAPQCTNTTPYQIGLDNGLHAVGNTRRMRSAGGRHVTYELYRDAGRSQRWGNTVNTDTVSATGDGSAQSLPIYARVAPQTTPPEGTYSDTVTVTIYY